MSENGGTADVVVVYGTVVTVDATVAGTVGVGAVGTARDGCDVLTPDRPEAEAASVDLDEHDESTASDIEQVRQPVNLTNVLKSTQQL